ncbi:MAG: nitroreductase family protein [Bacteroidales bacterium]|nr:nitroreductase family protein [Bacteroidales bacterium]
MKTVRILFVALALATTVLNSCAPKQEESNTTLETIFARKSVRSYTDQKLTQEQIETLLRAAMAAPSGMNLQPWRFVVVTDQSVKDALAGPRGGMIAKAGAVFVICGQTTMLAGPFGQNGSAPVEIENGNWTADCAAATQNLLLAAESLGLGAVWTACYPYPDRMSHVREILELPDGISPYCVVPVGYPAGDEKPKDKWKPENIHYDRW